MKQPTPLESAWCKAGDAGRVGLITGSIALPVARSQWREAVLTLIALAGAAGMSKGLKKLFPRWRPNREDQQSFPSEHAAETFAAAAMLANPIQPAAAAVAATTALSRRFADKHHLTDIVAGAAVGLAAASAVRAGAKLAGLDLPDKARSTS
jgi:membrane-associated phospholipid phosphatase